ncbi:MAG: cation-transporting P-type ATPase, partial [Clostridia bacterium]|nr:cation-transporting P-type ATPase [Clostridia bacterium]
MNEKWFSLDISSVERKLKTNAASGLSQKAARSRYRKGGEPLYISKKKSVGRMLSEIVADFSLILLIIASVLALCFTEYTTGVTLTVIIALNLGSALFLSYRSGKLFEGISSAFRPSVIVVRGGKAFSVDIERVVVGDVVLLSEGDVIGFDARLVTSDKLKVKVRVDRRTEAVAEKFAEGRVRDNENDVRAMVNMVHAGSTVISGGARAVVTATGLNTYFGALTGGIRLPDNKRVPHGLTLLKKYCSGFSFAIMLALLPFCILTLFFSKGNVTLMTSFSAALAISASSMSQLACTACRIFFAKHAREAIESQNPVAISSADVMDELVSVEYLLLLDGGAVSDGILHYYKAICADGELRSFNTISPSMKNFAELVAMYDSAEKRTLTTGIHTPGRFSRALDEFVNKNKVDREALQIRCSIAGYVPGNSLDKTDKLFFSDMGCRRILHVTQDASVIASCRHAYIGGGTSVLSANGAEELASQFGHYSQMGMKVLVFSVTDEEFSTEHTFAGMIVLSEALDNGFESAITGMEALGIKTLTFTRSDRANATQIPAPILDRSASREDFIRTGKDVTYKFGEIDTYRDMTAADIDAILRHIHSMGKKAALVCFSDEYKECREKPDVFVTCSSLQYSLSGSLEEQVETIEVPGGADSTSCRQDIKWDADIIIPRPSKRSGGLLSLKRA